MEEDGAQDEIKDGSRCLFPPDPSLSLSLCLSLSVCLSVCLSRRVSARLTCGIISVKTVISMQKTISNAKTIIPMQKQTTRNY